MDERKDVKGVSRFLFAEGADDDKLHLHVSEVGPGMRAHPPHQHAGQEIFYVLSGEGEVLVGDHTYTLRGGEAIQVDCEVEHGIVNVGAGPMRYAVIIART
jgi:quercetin dioxygenase-like cupin family protein